MSKKHERSKEAKERKLSAFRAHEPAQDGSSDDEITGSMAFISSQHHLSSINKINKQIKEKQKLERQQDLQQQELEFEDGPEECQNPEMLNNGYLNDPSAHSESANELG